MQKIKKENLLTDARRWLVSGHVSVQLISVRFCAVVPHTKEHFCVTPFCRLIVFVKSEDCVINGGTATEMNFFHHDTIVDDDNTTIVERRDLDADISQHTRIIIVNAVIKSSTDGAHARPFKGQVTMPDFLYEVINGLPATHSLEQLVDKFAHSASCRRF